MKFRDRMGLCRPVAFEEDNGFIIPGGKLHESSAIAEAFKIEADNVGCRILDEILKKTVLIGNQFIPHADQFVEADIFNRTKHARVIKHATALRDKGCVALFHIFPVEDKERQNNTITDIDCPKTVGTNDSRSVLFCDMKDFFIKGPAFIGKL
jgi:hypothetical protein